MQATLRRLAITLAIVSLAACKGNQEARRNPPPPGKRSKHAAACANGGGKIKDATTAPFFPTASGGYCIDPNGGEKTFGEAAALPLENICTDVFDGECEIYKGYGVRRVVEARYITGGGSTATIDVHLSRFATTEGAYGMFTRRVVGDGDPADDSTPHPIEGGGAAALGIGNAYLWRGLYLAEITYNDEAAAEATIKTTSEKLLPPFVKEMGDKLPGETALPPAAAALPKDGMIPLGIRFITKDMLNVDGAGPGALGYYKAGAKRYRVASILRADADQAKDVLGTFGKLPGASKEKNVGEGAVRFMHKDGEGAAEEWIFVRAGKALIGIGDEVRSLRSGMSADDHAKVTLTKDEKVERLKKLLPGG